MKTLFRQIKDLICCKVGWHDWNDDGQCEHCKTWHCEECKSKYEYRKSQRFEPSGERCNHGEFKSRCPICRR